LEKEAGVDKEDIKIIHFLLSKIPHSPDAIPRKVLNSVISEAAIRFDVPEEHIILLGVSGGIIVEPSVLSGDKTENKQENKSEDEKPD